MSEITDIAPLDEPVEAAAVELAPELGPVVPAPAAAPVAGVPREDDDLAPLLDVPVELVVELGRTRMTIGETLGIGKGSIVTLSRHAGEPVDLLVNGLLVARGEVVAVDEELGLRVTEVVSQGRAEPA